MPTAQGRRALRVEAFQTDLHEFLGPVRMIGRGAEGLALIVVAARSRPALQVLAGDGNCEVGPQACLLPALGLYHEQACAHRLARQLQQQAQRLQDRGVDA